MRWALLELEDPTRLGPLLRRVEDPGGPAGVGTDLGFPGMEKLGSPRLVHGGTKRAPDHRTDRNRAFLGLPLARVLASWPVDL